MTIDEAIERYTKNADHERTHGNLQGCLDFRQLATWLKELKAVKQIIESWKNGTIEEKDSICAFHRICEVVESEDKE